jgi:ABC-type transport system substrate-binding protein
VPCTCFASTPALSSHARRSGGRNAILSAPNAKASLSTDASLRVPRFVAVLAFVLEAKSAVAADPSRVLRIALDDITSLDPQQGTDLHSTRVTTHIFEGLHAFDYLATPAKVVPNTAEAPPATNISRFRNDEYDAAYERWVQTPPGAECGALAKRLSEIAQAYMPLTLHANGIANVLAYPSVQGYRPTLLGLAWKYLDVDAKARSAARK